MDTTTISEIQHVCRFVGVKLPSGHISLTNLSHKAFSSSVFEIRLSN